MSALVRRIAGSLLLIWLVVTLTFVLVRAAPGDAADLLVPPTATAADAARVRAELGLDALVAVQYARWMGAILKGDLGESFARREPVRRVLAESLPISLGLGGASLALTWILGVLVGALQGTRRGTPLDTSLTVLTATVYAAPSFWMALALVAVFTYGAAVWHFPLAFRLPAFGLHDPAGLDAGLADLVRHAVLPVLVLTAIGAAGVARYARSSVADLAGQPFVRTARAKGASPARVVGRHLLANALAPLVVLLALSLPGLVAGSVFVETVFAWPGMGQAMVSAIAARDTPVVLGATLAYAALVIAANLAADLVLPILDPRRRA